MRKRYTRKYRHESPRWKWRVQGYASLIEFERDWQGGRPHILKRRKDERDDGPLGSLRGAPGLCSCHHRGWV